MTIRKKSLLAIAITFVSLIVILFVISRFILLENLKKVEEENARQNVERALSALSYTLSNLESTTTDWSSWDDTYAFIEDVNDEYIKGNLVDETFIELSLNLMLFVNSSGQTIFGKAFDLHSEEEIQVPQSFQPHLSGDSPLLSHAGKESGISGILLLPESPPLLIASRPVLTSEDEGPIRGTLILGRYLESVEVSRLGELTSLSIASYSADDMELPADIHEVYPSLLQGASILVQPLDGQHIAGYTLIDDIYVNPALILKVDMPRDIYQEGQLGITYLILAITAVGVVLGGIAALLADKLGLSRLKHLAKTVETIGTSGNISERVSMTGNDEISRLAGNINGMLVALQDLYNKEARLRQELETEMKRRVEFTRALVHELKTPLTPILASSDALVAELKEAPLLRLAKNVNRGASRLNNRIDELLDLARGEMSTLQMDFESVDLLQLIREVTNEMIPEASRHGQSLTLDLPSSLPTVRADEDRLRQVVLNLLSNAFKFTPEGGKVTVKARKKNASLVVEVQDTGRGIAEEEQQRLFQPYYRQESDRSRFSGMGLGLALSKTLVELHGGKIWVESEKGKGSTFSFSVPLDAASQ